MNKREPYYSVIAQLRPKGEMSKKFKDLKAYYQDEIGLNRISQGDLLKILVNEKWKEKFDVTDS